VNRTCNAPTCPTNTTINRSINESQCRHWAQALLDAGLAGPGGAGFDYFVVQVRLLVTLRLLLVLLTFTLQEPCFAGRDTATGALLEKGGGGRGTTGGHNSYEERWPAGMKVFGGADDDDAARAAARAAAACCCCVLLLLLVLTLALVLPKTGCTARE